MQNVLIVIHLMIVLALVVVVLLQRSEGGALGIGGGGNFMSGRSQTNPLSRLTAYLAAGFFVTSLALTIIAGYGGGSVLDRVKPTAGTIAPAPAAPTGPSAPLGSGKGGILEDLQKMGGDRATPAQPSGAAGTPPQPSFDAPSAEPQAPAASQAPAPTPEPPAAQPAPADQPAAPAEQPKQP